MSNHTRTVWVDDDGSNVVGTVLVAQTMNNIEGSCASAVGSGGAFYGSAANASGQVIRPAASASGGVSEHWLHVDKEDQRLSFSDGQAWYTVSDGVHRKKSVQHVWATNVAIQSPGVLTDLATNVVNGDRVLLLNQTQARENGIYVYRGSNVPMVRANDCSTKQDFIPNFEVSVDATSGSTYRRCTFAFTATTSPAVANFGRSGFPVDVGVHGLTFALVDQAVITTLTVFPTNISSTVVGLRGFRVLIVPDTIDNPGVVWEFVYDPAGVGSPPWYFIGGAPMYAEVVAQQGTTTTANYVALATAGPTLSLPAIAGDFDIEIGARLNNSSANAGGLMSYDIGATGALDADSINFLEGATNMFLNLVRSRRKTGLAASQTITSKYKALLGGTANFEVRWMKITPVRCS